MEEQVTSNDPLGDKLKQEGVIAEETMSFNVKYFVNDKNTQTHQAFRQFAFDMAKGNYLDAIRLLMENYDEDWKYETISQRINALDVAVAELQSKSNEKKPAKPSRFGA